jgi:rare lipoprotein A
LALNFKLYPAFILLILFVNSAWAQESFTQKGTASYYGSKFQGKKTACGEIFDMNEYTAAHPKLPFQTLVKVTNLTNNRSVVVRINDRGPFTKKRIIDLSKAAAAKIGLVRTGTAKVKIEVVKSDKENEKDKKSYDKEPSNAVYNEINELKAGKTYNDHWHVKRPSGFGIQIESLHQVSYVSETLGKIKKEGIKDVYIQVLMINKKKNYRIIIGEYEDKKSAVKDLKKVENLGYKGFVKKYRF